MPAATRTCVLEPKSMSESTLANDHNRSFCVVYSGRSMNPTLMEPALIEVMATQANEIRKGDVIAFHHTEDATDIVHRVVNIINEGFRTRGDNNRHVDAYAVTADDIIGLAVAAWNGNRRRIIHGGNRGRIISWLLLGRIYVFMIAGRLLAGSYSRICRICSPLAQRLLPRRFQPRLVVYPEHVLWRYQLFIGEKLIGRCHTRTGKWEIRRPYRLIVNVRKLPQSTSK